MEKWEDKNRIFLSDRLSRAAVTVIRRCKKYRHQATLRGRYLFRDRLKIIHGAYHSRCKVPKNARIITLTKIIGRWLGYSCRNMRRTRDSLRAQATAARLSRYSLKLSTCSTQIAKGLSPGSPCLFSITFSRVLKEHVQPESFHSPCAH